MWLLVLSVLGSISVAAAGASAGTATPTPEPIPGLFNIRGCVVHFSGCGGSFEFGSVRIEPLGRTTQVDLGYFSFASVPPGEYVLSYFPPCNPAGCTRPQTVRIVDSDAYASFGRHRVECPPCQDPGLISISAPRPDAEAPVAGDVLRLAFSIEHSLPEAIDCGEWTIAAKPASPLLRLEGPVECNGSDAIIPLRAVAAGVAIFGLQVSARTEVECSYEYSGGCYSYRESRQVSASSSPVEIEIGDPPQPTNTPPASRPPCEGDCDLDGGVTVDEIQTMVATALGETNQPCSCQPCEEICAAVIGVDCITRGIHHALYGCPSDVGFACLGDCDGDGRVSEDELRSCMPSVSPSLVDVPVAGCCDGNDDGQTTTDEIFMIVNNQINGCP